MALVLIILGVLALAGLVLVARGTRGAPPPPRARTAPAAGTPAQQALAGAATAPATMPLPDPAPPAPPPPELQALRWRPLDQLDAAARDALLARLGGLRQPSRALQQLVSPAFIAQAGSVEVAELVKGEPLVSARILARANSPAYGLSQPLVQVGQAITFMGLNAVRSLCIQALMEESFKADSPERQALLDTTWRAASRGSEIAHRLAQQLRQPEPGLVATHVVLSFVGHLAAATLLPAADLPALQTTSLLARTQLTQERLGLPAAELGRLLMQSWGLPESLLNAAAGVDHLLVEAPEGDEAQRTALAYLSARWGEQLDERHYGGPTLDAADDHHLHALLQRPSLRRWRELAQGLEWAQAMERLMLTTQA